uniref:LAGLIDADG endonuclease n=1 Tax=Ramaria rubella TaxID=113071 RepID=UPI002237EABC
NFKLSYYRNIVKNKPYSMRRTLLFGGNCSSLNTMKEKLLLTWRKFAWIKILHSAPFVLIHQRLNVGHLISLRSFSTINKKSLSENKDIFYQWLVGFTDGHGTFSIVHQNNNWSLTFKISQNTYNLRILHFIKTQLKVGNIYIEKDGSHAHFRIRDRILLESVIFPIFDKYSLLTTKQFNYIKFKEAHTILSSTSLSKLEKDNLILKLIKNKPPVNYFSPVWGLIEKNVFNFDSASKIMSKSWLVGFTEAEGSFYLVAKSEKRLVHGFEITQKLDKIVLIAIKTILGISTNVKVKKTGTFSIVTTNSRAIENIIKYYKNTMKGMKSLEYRIWSRGYYKAKSNPDNQKTFQKLCKINKLLIKTRNTKLNFKNACPVPSISNTVSYIEKKIRTP